MTFQAKCSAEPVAQVEQFGEFVLGWVYTMMDNSSIQVSTLGLIWLQAYTLAIHSGLISLAWTPGTFVIQVWAP